MINENTATKEIKVNGQPKPPPVISLEASLEKHTTPMVTKNSRTEREESRSNVVQVPQWAITSFLIPMILFIIWFVRFYTNTENKLETFNEAIKKNEKSILLQDTWLRDTREMLIRQGISPEKIPPVPSVNESKK